VAAPSYKRIVILGKSGSGKTTLARQISQQLALPHIELDALHWEPHWTEAPAAVFRARVAAALSQPLWVVDGNYSRVRDLVWAQADTLLWLDYPLALTLRRLFRRTLRRLFRREVLWGNNHERWSNYLSLKPENNLFLWSIKSHAKQRREYPLLLEQPEHRHLHVLRLHNPRETTEWLRSLTASPASRNEG